jgi:hypothetical protein
MLPLYNALVAVTLLVAFQIPVLDWPPGQVHRTVQPWVGRHGDGWSRT